MSHVSKNLVLHMQEIRTPETLSELGDAYRAQARRDVETVISLGAPLVSLRQKAQDLPYFEKARSIRQSSDGFEDRRNETKSGYPMDRHFEFVVESFKDEDALWALREFEAMIHLQAKKQSLHLLPADDNSVYQQYGLMEDGEPYLYGLTLEMAPGYPREKYAEFATFVKGIGMMLRLANEGKHKPAEPTPAPAY